MKILVDELPEKSMDCPFSEFIQLPNMTTMRRCRFLYGISKCYLDCGKECPYLKKGETND